MTDPSALSPGVAITFACSSWVPFFLGARGMSCHPAAASAAASAVSLSWAGHRLQV